MLPDEQCFLKPASSLCCDSNLKEHNKLEFVSEFLTKGGSFVHPIIPRERAIHLGAYPILDALLKDIEVEDFLSGTSFGQVEDLVVRLNGILKKYPANSSIFKEFIQNADDAKATEIVFVLDHRTNHGCKNLLCDSRNWKELQETPALCIINNRGFLEEDLTGICQLGTGGKEDTQKSIGRFGIGFNVAYHITDCPTFISYDSSNNPTNFCVFDPLRRYCPRAEKQCRGRRWKIERAHTEKFPEQFVPFLEGKFDDLRKNSPNCLRDLSNGYVVFRLPLVHWKPTNETHSNKHYLKEADAGTSTKVKHLLESLTDDAQNMLLFVNNLQCISAFEITEDEDVVHHFTTALTASNHLNMQTSDVTYEASFQHTVTYAKPRNSPSRWLINKRLEFPVDSETVDIASSLSR